MSESKPPFVIRVEAGFSFIRIYMGTVLHLHIPRAGLAVQAWRDSDTNYSIEYTLGDGRKVLTQYDSAEKWRAILSGLEAPLS